MEIFSPFPKSYFRLQSIVITIIILERYTAWYRKPPHIYLLYGTIQNTCPCVLAAAGAANWHGMSPVPAVTELTSRRSVQVLPKKVDFFGQKRNRALRSV